MRNRWAGRLARHPRALGVLLAAYWCAMFVATHIEIPPTDSAPRNTDKLVHLVMYAGFTFLASAWLRTRTSFSPKAAMCLLGLAIVYAVLDELLQIPTQTRSAEVWDFVMDLLGSVLGLVMFWLVLGKLAWLWDAGEGPDNGEDSTPGLY